MASPLLGVVKLRIAVALVVPALTAIAQMKPSSSRPIAVTICGLVLASASQLFVSGAEPPLRFPGNILDFLIQSLLPFGQPAANPRFVLICPGRFHDHSSEMCVAGFGDAAALNASCRWSVRWKP